MLGEQFGHILDRPFKALATRIPFSANSITIAGFALTIAASLVLAHDLRMGALCLVPAVLLDKLDGIVARNKGSVTQFGAFLDSVLDRYADSAILLAIAWNIGNRGIVTGVILVFASLVGSLLVSYTRARAEGLGITCSCGLMERPERLVLLFVGSVSGYIVPTLWLLAGLTHLTAVQRIIYARKQFLK